MQLSFYKICKCTKTVKAHEYKLRVIHQVKIYKTKTNSHTPLQAHPTPSTYASSTHTLHTPSHPPFKHLASLEPGGALVAAAPRVKNRKQKKRKEKKEERKKKRRKETNKRETKKEREWVIMKL